MATTIELTTDAAEAGASHAIVICPGMSGSIRSLCLPRRRERDARRALIFRLQDTLRSQ